MVIVGASPMSYNAGASRGTLNLFHYLLSDMDETMTDYKQQLLDRLHNRTAKVGVIGMGYVGLPLAVEFARVGYHVIGLDVLTDKVDQAERRGELYSRRVDRNPRAAGRNRATARDDLLRRPA